jgi:hypothetical protein
MIYGFSCTRDEKLSSTSQTLKEYMSSARVNFHYLINRDCISSAYSEVLEMKTLEEDDIIIFCHDDIQILTPASELRTTLKHSLFREDVGFVGVAGTTRLDSDAVWWDHDRWKQKLHKGFAFHGPDKINMIPTYYGVPYNDQVVALDGLFLAAKVRTLKQLDLKKPVNYPGDWDFYDIFYTTQAHALGFKNHVSPIIIRHESFGELAGRDSWHSNRKAFINSNVFPIVL